MIPVCSLDPASLALWFEPSLLIRPDDEESPALQRALQEAAFGDPKAAARSLATVTRSPVRAAAFVSCIWHEHRHFLDLVLTNYGAFRVRQFFKLYINMAPVLHHAAKNESRVFFPLDAYLDPVRRAVHGLSDPPDDIRRLATSVKDAAEMVQFERMLVTRPSGDRFEVGGEAQLEALAYSFQMQAIDTMFGGDVSGAVQQHFVERYNGTHLSTWPLQLLMEAQIVEADRLGDAIFGVPPQVLTPILIGALAVRRGGQEQTYDMALGTGSGYANARLHGLMRGLAGRRFTGKTSSAEVWEAVNQVAKELWGRTVIEEMQHDYALEEQQLVAHVVDSKSVFEPVRDAIRDYHELRGKLLAILRNGPELLIDPITYAAEMLELVHPMPVMVSSAGKLPFEPPQGWSRLLGYQDESIEALWSWALTPKRWPLEPGIALEKRQAWIAITELYAPIAKLMMHGRTHRTVLGPELLQAEQRMRAMGWEITIEPTFATPAPLFVAADWLYELTDRTVATCDYCLEQVERAKATTASPWVIRQSAPIANLVIAARGGGTPGKRELIRDWSVWNLCPRCVDVFRTHAEA